MALYDIGRMLVMDEEGRMHRVQRREAVVGNIVVQETMILTNTLFARYLVEQGLPALFRNHQATPAAPSGAELAQTIKTWLESPDLNMARAVDTFRALIGRAVYSATVTGHYGVAEACYTHGTSPLRRYADLVNLRQLRAHLAGEPLPYTLDDLKDLGTALTQKAEDRKDERSQGFKEAAERKVLGAMARGELERLDDIELSRAVKLAAGDMPPSLTAELLRRFSAGTIAERVVDRMFTTIPAGAWPTDLLRVTSAWLYEAPTRAAHVLNHGLQEGWLTRGDVNCSGQGTEFDALVALTTDDGVSASGVATAPRKKEAELAATVAGICALIAGGGAGAAAVSAPPLMVAPAASSLGNPKSALNEICQKRGWPSPIYKSTGSGPSHAPRFDCTVTLEAGNFRMEATASGAATKKDAEAHATAKLLTQIPASPASAGAKAAAPAAPNPVGALQELAQKNKWAMPAYTTREITASPPLFEAVVVVAGPAAGRYTGRAANKQDAKSQAAKAALSA